MRTNRRTPSTQCSRELELDRIALGIVAVATTVLIACSDADQGVNEPGIMGVAGSPSLMPSAGSGAPGGPIPNAGGAAPPGSVQPGMTAGGAGDAMQGVAGGGEAMAGAGASGAMPGAGASGAMPSDADYAKYHDPGKGPWEMGTPEECRLDPAMVGPGQNLAVFRYGKLCHIQGGNTTIANWSATKTLGGVLAGRAAYLVKDIARSGPGTGPILHEDKLSDWGVSTSGLNADALLSHVMSMTAYNSNLMHGSKSYTYDTLGTREISRIVDVAMKAIAQVPSMPQQETAFMRQEVFEKLGMEASSWPGGTIGYGWTSSLEDMGRIGVMLAHDGWYGGERFMEASWVYRMSHPAHEDANTAYGQLAWLGNRGNGSGFGAAYDTCAPAAFWPEYPHVGSEATDCGATMGASCEQEHDVGIFLAAGLGGQYIVMHSGLDLVIAGHNSTSAEALWTAVRPAVVAKDPMFMGDEMAFCEAYGAGSYAPDLLVPRVAPMK
jgi:hypothetical protein